MGKPKRVTGNRVRKSSKEGSQAVSASHASSGREIVQSLLSTTTTPIESFEKGRSKDELDRHYAGVSIRLERAASGRG